jgi:hypothetical protein
MPDARRSAWLRLWHARVSYVLEQAGVEHVLIKGSTWSGPLARAEAPADVDVLVAPAHFQAALAALRVVGCTLARPGIRDGETVLYSTTLRSPDGPDIDVHRSFPGLDIDPDASWRVLMRHRRHEHLGHFAVPVLPQELQLLVAAAAAARDGDGSATARGLASAAPSADWVVVVRLAREMGADGTLRAGLTAAGQGERADLLELGPVPFRFVTGNSVSDKRFEEVLAAPWRRRLTVGLRELWPTPAFLRLSQPGVPTRTARRRHLSKLGRELPPALRRALARRLRR